MARPRSTGGLSTTRYGSHGPSVTTCGEKTRIPGYDVGATATMKMTSGVPRAPTRYATQPDRHPLDAPAPGPPDGDGDEQRCPGRTPAPLRRPRLLLPALSGPG